ncbi:hypothetical protein PR202_ga18579 [Eleusine coracana subsp. coracana]|uniref:Uncharacterized protein n=1 Tax=Eleusine coracana subsp. coracana TaxID=191504 RepID=A0AAV5CTH6_ELECO|nr:hypothetical protein PR202_ga18579 [Eleusine coracana subsp. coracana]
MAIQVDGRRTVGPEAFAKIAPACPSMAHPITVRNLFDALTNTTGGRLHFLIYYKYLKNLDQLTLTSDALYFEAIGVDFSYGEAVVYDLSKDQKQLVKRESTGPWGAHLFDKAVMYKSSSTSEPVFFEFPQFKGCTRRDYWFAVIKEVLHAHKFIRKYKLTSFQKAEALSVATLGILRHRTMKEGFHVLPTHFKTTLAFNLAEKLPKGDKILEALYGQLQEHCSSRFRGSGDFAQSSSSELTLADPFPLSAYTMVRMGLLTLEEEGNGEERDLTVRDVQIRRTSSVQMALDQSLGYSGRVVAARESLNQELLFPLIELGKVLLALADWEDTLKSYVFLFCFLYTIYSGWIWFMFPGFLLACTLFMQWHKYYGNGQLIGAFEVTTSPRRRTVEQLLALQEAISQLEAQVQAANIFLLKLRSLLLAAFPQSTNKVAPVLVVAAAAFTLVPFRNIVLLILLEAYTRQMPLRRESSEKLVRRLREWWLRIPAAPVQLQRPQENRWRSRMKVQRKEDLGVDLGNSEQQCTMRSGSTNDYHKIHPVAGGSPPPPDHTTNKKPSLDDDQLPITAPPAAPHRIRNKRRGRCCRCVCWTTLIIVALVALGATAGILYLVFRPKIPNFNVDRLTVTRFDVNATSMTATGAFDVDVTATNPNRRIGVYYDGGEVTASFNGTELCRARPVPCYK